MKIKASTLSVIMRDSDSVHCYLEISGKSCNVSLRFDRGEKAMICGYPQRWAIHDEEVNGDSSVRYSDLVECDGEELDGYHDVYVSKETEAEILKKLKRSIERQFEDCSWMDMELTLKFQLSVLNKINAAIEAVHGE